MKSRFTHHFHSTSANAAELVPFSIPSQTFALSLISTNLCNFLSSSTFYHFFRLCKIFILASSFLPRMALLPTFRSVFMLSYEMVNSFPLDFFISTISFFFPPPLPPHFHFFTFSFFPFSFGHLPGNLVGVTLVKPSTSRRAHAEFGR